MATERRNPTGQAAGFQGTATAERVLNLPQTRASRQTYIVKMSDSDRAQYSKLYADFRGVCYLYPCQVVRP